MKRTRLLALVMAVLFAWLPCAHAQSNHLAYFDEIENMNVVMLEEADRLTAPKELEGMYALFAQGNPDATVYLFQMPNGRAMLSLSCLETAGGDVEPLLEQADELSLRLTEDLGDALLQAPQFELAQRFDHTALTLDTLLSVPDGESTRMLEGHAIVFYRGSDLIELWAVYPKESGYLFDQDARSELKADVAALKQLVESLDFSLEEEGAQGDEQSSLSTTDLDSMVAAEVNESVQEESTQLVTEVLLEGEAKEDDWAVPHRLVMAEDGTFFIMAPADVVVLGPSSTVAEVDAIRQQLAAYEGGEKVFDLWYKDVTDENSYLLISMEQMVAAQVFVSDAGYFAGLPAEGFLELEQPILEMMQEQYDDAKVCDDPIIADVDGLRHGWMTYALNMGELNLLTYVLAAADEDHLYEIDVYAMLFPDTDAEAVTETVLMLLETLDYLPQQQI